MVSQQTLYEALPKTLSEITLPDLGPPIRGKVRDSYVIDKKRVLVTSDRLSAFDVVLTTIPFKGQVLNGIASFWFEKTKHLVPNHLLSSPHPSVFIGEQLQIIPIEVVIRRHLAGSAWRDYAAGKPISGITLPEGLREFARLPEPILTPSTKAPSGLHDEPISHAEILRRGIVSESVWNDVGKKAHLLFQVGEEWATKQGLILVDTKYEFGIRPETGEVVVADEIHTPDSSRYWEGKSWERHLETGVAPTMLDKEFFRRWLIQQGWQGDGPPPTIPDEKRVEIASRYIELFESVTGDEFIPDTSSPQEISMRIAEAL